ncbi:hypothetical protein [Nonomuraea sediminis]|uniref:hypothetical protein n=1 Tax=Nonomuraea sediminis TaxID=2835864 RepID=UPI001BDDC80E|nr:hypothetical protein [Nonomuraea sediminis]
MAMSSLENKVCGIDPLTGHRTAKCGPVGTLARVMFYAWLFAPVGCVMLGALVSYIPRRLYGARVAALAGIMTWPMAIVGVYLLYPAG